MIVLELRFEIFLVSFRIIYMILRLNKNIRRKAQRQNSSKKYMMLSNALGAIGWSYVLFTLPWVLCELISVLLHG